MLDTNDSLPPKQAGPGLAQQTITAAAERAWHMADRLAQRTHLIAGSLIERRDFGTPRASSFVAGLPGARSTAFAQRITAATSGAAHAAGMWLHSAATPLTMLRFVALNRFSDYSPADPVTTRAPAIWSAAATRARTLQRSRTAPSLLTNPLYQQEHQSRDAKSAQASSAFPSPVYSVRPEFFGALAQPNRIAAATIDRRLLPDRSAHMPSIAPPSAPPATGRFVPAQPGRTPILRTLRAAGSQPAIARIYGPARPVQSYDSVALPLIAHRQEAARPAGQADRRIQISTSLPLASSPPRRSTSLPIGLAMRSGIIGRAADRAVPANTGSWTHSMPVGSVISDRAATQRYPQAPAHRPPADVLQRKVSRVPITTQRLPMHAPEHPPHLQAIAAVPLKLHRPWSVLAPDSTSGRARPALAQRQLIAPPDAAASARSRITAAPALSVRAAMLEQQRNPMPQISRMRLVEMGGLDTRARAALPIVRPAPNEAIPAASISRLESPPRTTGRRVAASIALLKQRPATPSPSSSREIGVLRRFAQSARPALKPNAAVQTRGQIPSRRQDTARQVPAAPRPRLRPLPRHLIARVTQIARSLSARTSQRSSPQELHPEATRASISASPSQLLRRIPRLRSAAPALLASNLPLVQPAVTLTRADAAGARMPARSERKSIAASFVVHDSYARQIDNRSDTVDRSLKAIPLPIKLLAPFRTVERVQRNATPQPFGKAKNAGAVASGQLTRSRVMRSRSAEPWASAPTKLIDAISPPSAHAFDASALPLIWRSTLTTASTSSAEKPARPQLTRQVALRNVSNRAPGAAVMTSRSGAARSSQSLRAAASEPESPRLASLRPLHTRTIGAPIQLRYPGRQQRPAHVQPFADQGRPRSNRPTPLSLQSPQPAQPPATIAGSAVSQPIARMAALPMPWRIAPAVSKPDVAAMRSRPGPARIGQLYRTSSSRQPGIAALPLLHGSSRLDRAQLADAALPGSVMMQRSIGQASSRAAGSKPLSGSLARSTNIPTGLPASDQLAMPRTGVSLSTPRSIELERYPRSAQLLVSARLGASSQRKTIQLRQTSITPQQRGNLARHPAAIGALVQLARIPGARAAPQPARPTTRTLHTNPRPDRQSAAGDTAAGTRKGRAYNLRHENADWYQPPHAAIGALVQLVRILSAPAAPQPARPTTRALLPPYTITRVALVSSATLAAPQPANPTTRTLHTNPRPDRQSSASDTAAGTRKGYAYNLRHENAGWYQPPHAAIGALVQLARIPGAPAVPQPARPTTRALLPPHAAIGALVPPHDIRRSLATVRPSDILPPRRAAAAGIPGTPPLLAALEARPAQDVSPARATPPTIRLSAALPASAHPAESSVFAFLQPPRRAQIQAEQALAWSSPASVRSRPAWRVARKAVSSSGELNAPFTGALGAGMTLAAALVRPMSAAVQRFAEPQASSDSGMYEALVATSATSARQQPATPDIDSLARQIYDRIRYRLLADAERLGRQRY